MTDRHDTTGGCRTYQFTPSTVGRARCPCKCDDHEATARTSKEQGYAATARTDGLTSLRLLAYHRSLAFRSPLSRGTTLPCGRIQDGQRDRHTATALSRSLSSALLQNVFEKASARGKWRTRSLRFSLARPPPNWQGGQELCAMRTALAGNGRLFGGHLGPAIGECAQLPTPRARGRM